MEKFKLAIVEIYNPHIHGVINNTLKYILYNNYIVKDTINLSEFYSNINNLKDDLIFLNQRYKFLYGNPRFKNHPFVKNYSKIIKNNYFKIDIIKEVTIDNTTVGIKKTFWIKIIQRKWKKFYHNKINSLSNIKNLFYREISGNFPKECFKRFKLELKN